MNLKHRILLFLALASIVVSMLTSVLLFYLLKQFPAIEQAMTGLENPILIVFAVVVYLLSGLTLLVLMNLMLGRSVVIPAVEREMMVNERAMLTEQLHQAQKMEAVGRLAGSIAHDFNNLLTIIDGYSSLIIADPQAKETGQNAQEVVEAARKASFITRKLLSFSQKDQSEPVLLDLNTTLQDTHKMLTRLIGEKISLITKPHDEPLFVLADPVQIGQVLMNLAVNARDAMPNGGRITIKVGLRQMADGTCGKPDRCPAGPYAQISVHDTGHGMDEQTLGHIFEAFFTTKQEGKGTGLGLSIVKSIVKQNHGFIDVQSRIGGGTTFQIYLPVEQAEEESQECRDDPSMDAMAQSAATATAPAGSATILLVEDDPMIRTLVTQTLEMQGYHVLQAEEGWEGIKVARNHKGKIDLLFTDVVMPGLGGVELALAASELYPEIRVLFMSGYSRSQLEEEGVPSTAAVLEKPFTSDKVISMVRQLLAR